MQYGVIVIDQPLLFSIMQCLVEGDKCEQYQEAIYKLKKLRSEGTVTVDGLQQQYDELFSQDKVASDTAAHSSGSHSSDASKQSDAGHTTDADHAIDAGHATDASISSDAGHGSSASQASKEGHTTTDAHPSNSSVASNTNTGPQVTIYQGPTAPAAHKREEEEEEEEEEDDEEEEEEEKERRSLMKRGILKSRFLSKSK